MKYYVSYMVIMLSLVSLSESIMAQPTRKDEKHYYIDVHRLPEGKVNFKDVAAAHLKDLAVQRKHNVEFIKFWVDEKQGTVYCLSTATDSSNIREAHREAHGLLPQEILQVEEGVEALPTDRQFFIDVHELGAGKVKAADVAKAHEKDLAVQGKYGVNFINYWVDEKRGVVVCLSQASDSFKIIQTHKEAHGLVPVSVEAVKQGQ